MSFANTILVFLIYHNISEGMSDYMAKPVKFEELQTLLHDWLLCQPIVTKSA